jgi:hypothetical protein
MLANLVDDLSQELVSTRIGFLKANSRKLRDDNYRKLRSHQRREPFSPPISTVHAVANWLFIRLVPPSRNKPHRVLGDVVVLVVLVAYPLSLGPACWLCDWGYIDENAIQAFYGPLCCVARRSGMDLFCRIPSSGQQPKD